MSGMVFCDRARASGTKGTGAEKSEVRVDLFDLELSLNSGQVFHWERHRTGWLGMIGAEACYVEQAGKVVRYAGASRESVERYFALDHRLAEIQRSFPSDDAMDAAVLTCRGLRILRQPRWECIATFITSSQKSVVHIGQISRMLRERFGKPVRFEDRQLFEYPSPRTIAGLSEAELRACALGYRAKNLRRAAQMIADGEVDLAKVSALSDDAAREELCRLAGVGPKVANCALLFGFERLRAFPIDVWIERVLRERYFAGERKVTAKQLEAFCADYFGPNGGYAQQYLFHHARKTKLRAHGD